MGGWQWTLGVGLVAGAAGKAALDLTTYADMLIRGRPASKVPAKVARTLATDALTRFGDLVGEDPELLEGEADDDQPGPRASAAGALSGYAIGLGLGVGYAMVRDRMATTDAAAPLLGGAALGVLAMGGSDVPAVLTGATSDPRRWPASSWLADILPHLAYGLATALSVEALLRDRRRAPVQLLESVRR